MTTELLKPCEAGEPSLVWPYIKRCDATATHDVTIVLFNVEDPWTGKVCTFHLDLALHSSDVEAVEAHPLTNHANDALR